MGNPQGQQSHVCPRFLSKIKTDEFFFGYPVFFSVFIFASPNKKAICDKFPVVGTSEQVGGEEDNCPPDF